MLIRSRLPNANAFSKLIRGFAVAVPVFASMLLTSSASAQSVTVGVDWNTALQTIPTTAWGVDNPGFMVPADTASTSWMGLVNAITLKKPLIRIHGWGMLNRGNSSPDAWLNSDGTWNASKIASALAPVAAAGYNIMIDVPDGPNHNFSTDAIDPDMINNPGNIASWLASLVKIVNVDNHFNVKYWEFPNEREPYISTGQMVTLLNSCSVAMKNASPSFPILVGGPATAWLNVGYIQSVVQGCGTNIDFVTTHDYGYGANLQAYYNAAQFDTGGSGSTIASMRSGVNSVSGGRHIPIFLDEYDVQAGSSPYNKDSDGAVYDVLIATGTIHNGGDASQFWEISDNDDNNSLIQNLTTRYPISNYLTMLNQYFYGQEMSATTTNNTLVDKFAAKSTSGSTTTYSLVLINRSDSTQTVGLNYTGFTPSSLSKYVIDSTGFSGPTTVGWPVSGGLSMAPRTIAYLIGTSTSGSAPPTPTGLTASAGNAQVSLSWNASSGATAYDVKRSTVSGLGYVTVSSPTTTSYTNTGLSNGTTYYFVVDAKNTFGTSGNSSQASATPTASSISFKQQNSNDPVSASSIAVAYSSAETAGDLNIVVIGWNNTTGAVSSVTDSAGNTYSRAIGPTVDSDAQQSIYYASNVHAGSDTVTVTMSTTVAYPDVRILEYSGVTTLDKTAGASGTGTAASSGSATTTAANELIFTANTCDWNTISVGSGFTNRVTTIDGNIAADETVSATGSYSGTATLSNSSPWTMQMVTFKGGGGSAPAAPTGLTAVPGNAQVTLAWNASSGATSYNVLRSTVSGSGYASVATGIASTTYTNTGLTNGTTYYFVVTAANSSGTSGNSNQAAAKPVLAPAFVQVNSNDPVSASSIAVAYSAAQTAGNLNIVVVGWNDTTSSVSSVTDSAGNSYSLAIGPNTGGGQRQSIYYAKNIKGGSNTVTVTMSGSVPYPDIRVLEYTGVGALDVTSGANGTSSSPNSGSATTTTARELIFTANTCYPSTTAVGAGFTSRITTVDGDIAADKAVTTAGSYNGSATLAASDLWVMQMATFK